jgi:protein YibB
MFTVVTGFFDIGRSDWDSFNRSTEDYMRYFKNLLSLKANMIIFVEQKNAEFVYSIRSQITGFKTTIILKTIEGLYMSKYTNKIYEIQADPEYGKNLSEEASLSPEISKPLYNIVTCSKMDLLYQALSIDSESDYFIWLDAGYTHGTVDLANLDWNPVRLFENKDRFSLISLQNLSVMSNDPVVFFNQHIDVVIGGFLGGHRSTIETVKNMFYEKVEYILYNYNLKDDDQYFLALIVNDNPQLFNLYMGNWYDAILL